MNAIAVAAVVAALGGGTPAHPAASPDGRQLAFAADMGDYPAQQGIYAMRANGSHLRRVTFLSQQGAYDLAPRFTADGKKMTFTRIRSAGTKVLSTTCVTTLRGRQVRCARPWREVTPRVSAP